MAKLMRDKDRPWAAHPSVWAPFVVVGEGGARDIFVRGKPSDEGSGAARMFSKRLSAP
jgi:hypothetical protein